MTSFVEGIALTLFLGAARAEATPEQLDRLRELMPPALQSYRRNGDEGPVRAAVAAVLGAGWEPSGEWAMWLRSVRGAE